MSGIVSPKEVLDFFFFLRTTENKTNALIIGLGGKTEKSLSSTTPEKMGARSATICFCLNPMIFRFPGLESLGSFKWLKQDNPRLLRFPILLFYHLGDKPHHCFVNSLDIHRTVIQYFEGTRQKLCLFKTLENHSQELTSLNPIT